MFISADRFRVITKADMHAAALIAEGFRRLREQQKPALDGAQSKSREAGCSDSESVNVGNHEPASQGLGETP